MSQLLNVITHYWEILLFLATLLFHAIWTYFTVNAHENRIKCLEDDADKTEEIINSVLTKMSSMDAKLDILLEGYRKK